MQIHHGYRGYNFRNPVVTMGVFDGVHLGHRMLLERVVSEASTSGSDSVAVTFDPHPRIVLSGNPEELRFLTDIEERTELMRGTGLDHLVIIPFTADLSRMTAKEFLEEVLCRHLGVRHLITGFDHHFGRRQEGDSDTLLECSGVHDFRVTREKALVIKGRPVSSSGIRKLLEEGDVRNASELLGYDYFIRGTVVSGKRIGREIGFPTANIAPLFSYKLIPGTGVYAVEATIAGDPEKYMAMLNIGYRPTIEGDNTAQTIEAHIIGLNSDLYGKEITVSFRERLRDEMRFESMDALVRQLERDRDLTVTIMSR